MGERASHAYACHSLGCSNGHMSMFEGAPPEWFADKGFSTPKNCPDCRKWIKAQVDSAYRCKNCTYPIRQSAKVKISHHKRKGVYEPPVECRRCESDRENGKKSVVELEELEDVSKQKFVQKFLKNAGFNSPEYRVFDDNVKSYDAPQKRGSSETRREHLEVHAPYTPDVTRPGKKTTKTGFGANGGSFSAYLRGIGILAAEEHPECALEKRSKGLIVKVNTQTFDLVILKVDNAGPPPVHSAVTTFRLDLKEAKHI